MDKDYRITDEETLKQYYAYCPKCGQKIHPIVRAYNWFGFDHCYFEFDLTIDNVNLTTENIAVLDDLIQQYKANPGNQTLMQFLTDRGISEDEYRLHFLYSLRRGQE